MFWVGYDTLIHYRTTRQHFFFARNTTQKCLIGRNLHTTNKILRQKESKRVFSVFLVSHSSAVEWSTFFYWRAKQTLFPINAFFLFLSFPFSFKKTTYSGDWKFDNQNGIFLASWRSDMRMRMRLWRWRRRWSGGNRNSGRVYSLFPNFVELSLTQSFSWGKGIGLHGRVELNFHFLTLSHLKPNAEMHTLLFADGIHTYIPGSFCLFESFHRRHCHH